ncbi:Pfam:DUF395 [Aspergillus sp. HF37]|nr:Pfam:DUF395 [Aspergillus sp. HF37]
MSTDLVQPGIAGALFGSGLTASGVYFPDVILAQMELRNFHMLKVFLSASCLSALFVTLYERLIRKQLPRRPPSNLGLWSSYDGNVIGGAMVGVGMALTGACPGTVLLQLATGLRSGIYVMVGCLLGGVVYTGFVKPLRQRANQTQTSTASAESHALATKLGVDPAKASVLFAGMCAVMVLGAAQFAPGQTKALVPAVVGGGLIGVAQLSTLILTKAPVGVSTCYEDFGAWFWKACAGEGEVLPRSKSVAFATGVLASAAVMAATVPGVAAGDDGGASISLARGVLGGFVMVVGARLAGGCTSGHGISGMSMLGVSSLITVASMFGAGIAVAAVI